MKKATNGMTAIEALCSRDRCDIKTKTLYPFSFSVFFHDVTILVSFHLLPLRSPDQHILHRHPSVKYPIGSHKHTSLPYPTHASLTYPTHTLLMIQPRHVSYSCHSYTYIFSHPTRIHSSVFYSQVVLDILLVETSYYPTIILKEHP